MLIVEIKDLARKKVPIYYRMVYGGVAVFEFAGKVVDVRIEFTIEMQPTGVKHISIVLEDKPEYPLVPLKAGIKHKIEELDAAGKLPI
jgi:hypothetical protein